ncbi:MAG: amidohydrolase family protein [Terriglobia bacterium]
MTLGWGAARQRAPSSPVALRKAGVKFAFYLEGAGSPKDALKDVRKAIDAGTAPDAALRAFTLSPAEILGVGDRLSSIEPGKIANLVVADGDQMADLIVTDGDPLAIPTQVRYLFINGEFTSTDNRHLRLCEEYRKRPRETK